MVLCSLVLQTVFLFTSFRSNATLLKEITPDVQQKQEGRYFYVCTTSRSVGEMSLGVAAPRLRLLPEELFGRDVLPGKAGRNVRQPIANHDSVLCARQTFLELQPGHVI